MSHCGDLLSSATRLRISKSSKAILAAARTCGANPGRINHPHSSGVQAISVNVQTLFWRDTARQRCVPSLHLDQCHLGLLSFLSVQMHLQNLFHISPDTPCISTKPCCHPVLLPVMRTSMTISSRSSANVHANSPPWSTTTTSGTPQWVSHISTKTMDRVTGCTILFQVCRVVHRSSTHTQQCDVSSVLRIQQALQLERTWPQPGRGFHSSLWATGRQPQSSSSCGFQFSIHLCFTGSSDTTGSF